jgi:hypothetical protein
MTKPGLNGDQRSQHLEALAESDVGVGPVGTVAELQERLRLESCVVAVGLVQPYSRDLSTST